MKVLFIFKSDNFLAPLGICVLSSVIKAEGHDSYLCELNTDNPLKRINDIMPDVIAYSSSTGEAKHYLGVNKSIKERFGKLFTIMGGPHPTFFPDVINTSNLDAICIGEGEYAFCDLLKVLETSGSIENIPNIVTKNNFGSYTVRNLISNLDDLPFPDYGIIYDNLPMGDYPLKNFMISRGCPFNCTYCFNAKWNSIYKGKGSLCRRHSVDHVIEDIKRVKEKWPLSTVKFYDDIFTVKADDWLKEFSKKYKIEIGLPFFILTRADVLSEEMVVLLKEAGCRTISMSIETGNSDLRNSLLKRNMTDEQIINAHRLCDKYGIYTFTNCIVGLPGSTIDSEIESIELAVKSRVTWSEFLIFHPYPSTELGDRLIKEGLYEPKYDKMHTSYMNRSPLKNFSEKEKNAHKNLSVLGAVAVVFPAFRKVIYKLIFIKHNFIFTMIYYLIKMYIIRKKIYVTKTSFGKSMHIFIRSLKQEFFRHESEDIVK